jgi:hypothetical protein
VLIAGHKDGALLFSERESTISTRDSATPPPRLVLSLDREADRLAFTEIVLPPEPIEEIEAELPPKRFFYDLPVAFASSGRPGLDRAQDVFVDREGGTDLGHRRVSASRLAAD